MLQAVIYDLYLDEERKIKRRIFVDSNCVKDLCEMMDLRDYQVIDLTKKERYEYLFYKIKIDRDGPLHAKPEDYKFFHCIAHLSPKKFLLDACIMMNKEDLRDEKFVEFLTNRMLDIYKFPTHIRKRFNKFSLNKDDSIELYIEEYKDGKRYLKSYGSLKSDSFSKEHVEYLLSYDSDDMFDDSIKNKFIYMPVRR